MCAQWASIRMHHALYSIHHLVCEQGAANRCYYSQSVGASTEHIRLICPCGITHDIKTSNWECNQHSQAILENICYLATLPVIPCLHLLEALMLPPTAMMRLKNRVSTTYGLVQTYYHWSSKLASLHIAYSNGCSKSFPAGVRTLAPNYLCIKSYNNFLITS